MFNFQFRFTYEGIPYRLGITVEEKFSYGEARGLAIQRFQLLMPHVPVDTCELVWF